MTSPPGASLPRIDVPSSRTWTLLTVLLVVAVLYLGRDILMPLGLALLASFVIGRPVAFLEKWGLGRVWAVGLVAGVLVILVGGSGWVAWTQLSGVLDEVPDHSAAIKEKVGALTRRIAAFQAAGEAFVKDASNGVLAGAEHASADAPPTAAVVAPPQPSVSPMDVAPNLLRQMPAALGLVWGPIGTAGMVVLFAVFMLLHREDLRNRFLRLIGSDDLTGTTLALADASNRIGHYLGMQVLVNGTAGIAVAVALLLLGVPGWALWGFLYALLRFLPYVGPILGVAMPVAVALAISPGWGLFLATLGVLLSFETTINLVVEPWLYGGKTGVSSFAVLVAAAFWTWLWGPIGLLLAMPLTVVIVVLGKAVHQLRFLHVLFGTDEVLSLEDRYYQRAIANDLDEAGRILAEVAGDAAIGDVHERVVVPGLRAAERDRVAGKLTEEAYVTVCDNIRDSLEEMELRRAAVTEGGKSRGATAVDPIGGDPHGGSQIGATAGVVCVPVTGGANAVAAEILCRLLQQSGHVCRTLSRDLTFREQLASIAETETVCLVTLPDPTLRVVGAMCRRLREQRPGARIVVLVWGATVDATVWRYRSLAENANAIATTVAEVLRAVALDPAAVA